MSHLKHTRTLVEAALYGGQRLTPSELPDLIAAIGRNLKGADTSTSTSHVYEERTLENGVRMRLVHAPRRSSGHVRDILRH